MYSKNNSGLYESVIENLGEGLIVVNNSLKILLFNQKAEELTGISRFYTENAMLNDIFISNPWLSNIVRNVLEKGYTVSDYSKKFKTTGNRSLPVGVTASLFITKDGNKQGVIITIKDMSGLRPLEDDRLRNERLAFLGTLSAGIAHEVRNPLGGIKGSIQLLSKRLKDKDLLEYTQVINKEVNRINKVLEELLRFSNPRKYTYSRLNIHRIIDHVLSLFHGEVKNRKIIFIKMYDPSIPDIAGDEDSLIQAFLNLIKNAIEAIGNNGNIGIKTKFIPDFLIGGSKDTAKTVSIEIMDTGCGMSKEEEACIFTPFYTTKDSGTGIGLPITLKIIKEHGGFIDIKSLKQEGTKITVFLPLPKA